MGTRLMKIEGRWVLADIPGQKELFHAEPGEAPHSPKADWHKKMIDKYYKPGMDPDYDEAQGNKKEYCEDCNEDHSPSEGHRECAACGKRHEYAEEKEEHEGVYTDWDQHYPNVGHEIHRGMPVELPMHVKDVVHHLDNVSDADRAHAISKHIGTRNLGMHWTDHLPAAEDFTHRTANQGDTEIIVHAHKPEKHHIETDLGNLQEGGVYSYDTHEEAEVPLQNRAPVKVKGISWRRKPFTDLSHYSVNDWTRHDFDEPHHHEAIRRTAAHKFVPQDHSGTGIMVAFAPPKHVVDGLKLEDEHAEPAHDLHVTMTYLGKTEEYTSKQLAALPEVVSSWAEGHKAPKLTVQGSGTFLAPDEDSPHVLHALVNSPGIHRMQAHLVDHLKAHGYKPREDHGYIPHITLGYTRHTVRFLPKVKRHEWVAKDIWSAIGEKRQPHRFGNDSL